MSTIQLLLSRNAHKEEGWIWMASSRQTVGGTATEVQIQGVGICTESPLKGTEKSYLLGDLREHLWGTSHCRLSIYHDRDWGVGGTNTRSKARPGREPRPVWAGLGWGRVSRKYGQQKSFLVGPSHNAKTVPLRHSILLSLPIMHPETLPKSHFFQDALTFHPTPISTYHNDFNMWAHYTYFLAIS